jgi:hypothetical protein
LEAETSNAIQNAFKLVWQARVVQNYVAARNVLVQSSDRVFVIDFGVSEVHPMPVDQAPDQQALEEPPVRQNQCQNSGACDEFARTNSSRKKSSAAHVVILACMTVAALAEKSCPQSGESVSFAPVGLPSFHGIAVDGALNQKKLALMGKTFRLLQ